MSNTKQTPIRKVNPTQSAWLRANGIETFESKLFAGLAFYRASNESTVYFYGGRWSLEERDYCEDGDGGRCVGTFDNLKDALAALRRHVNRPCGCCAHRRAS